MTSSSNFSCTFGSVASYNLMFSEFSVVQAKERILRLIEDGVSSGARLLLDGRDIKVFV